MPGMSAVARVSSAGILRGKVEGSKRARALQIPSVSSRVASSTEPYAGCLGRDSNAQPFDRSWAPHSWSEVWAFESRGGVAEVWGAVGKQRARHRSQGLRDGVNEAQHEHGASADARRDS